jgi:hypothetical protein
MEEQSDRRQRLTVDGKRQIRQSDGGVLIH